MSRELLTQFERANDGIASLLDADLQAFLDSVNFNRPAAAKLDLFDFVPALVGQYGDMSATVAADWFEELRSAEGVPGSFRAPLAPLVPDEVVNGRLGFATRPGGPLFAEDSSVLKQFVALMANEYALQPGRDTVIAAAREDNAAYARIPEPGACKFCLMLASRGFVYSRESSGETKKFHGKCRCNVMPAWDETRARVEYGYDPDALYERYRDAQ